MHITSKGVFVADWKLARDLRKKSRRGRCEGRRAWAFMLRSIERGSRCGGVSVEVEMTGIAVVQLDVGL